MHNAILTDGVIRELNRRNDTEREADYQRQREQAEWEVQAERDWQNQEAERMASEQPSRFVNKTVLLQLEGQDGNAFSLMGAFQHQAKKEGWTPEEIETVLTEAQSGDYEHLLTTISEHCRDTDDF